MRWLRLLIALLVARSSSRLPVDGESVLDFRVWLTDVDASIMNHAAMMTVFEAGRIDFMIRSGFFGIARKNKWYFPSSAISVQFNRPLKLFQKARMTTAVLNVDENWIYTYQKITRNGKEIAACLVKSTVKRGKEHVTKHELLTALDVPVFPENGEQLILAFEKSNAVMRGT
jgi:acyl-CoA thioesterase FadM